MKEVGDVTVMCFDHGLFADMAVRLAEDFKRVLYHVPSFDPWPTVNPTMIGYGLEGIEVVSDPYEHLPYVDLCIFLDVGFADIQEHMVDLGKAVWGSRKGELLELDRELCKEVMEEVGLPVGKFSVLKGIKKLTEFLKKNKDQYVKISRFRGLGESFFAKDYKSIEPRLDKLAYDLGPLQELQEFDCESALPDKVELGTDIYTVDGQYPSQSLLGWEIKDAGYAGLIKPLADYPKSMNKVTDALSPVLEDYGYRGFLSTEVRIGKDGKPFLIDMTCRMPNPPWQLYCTMYKNLSQIIWAGANGEMVDPIPVKKFGAILMLKSDWADAERWCPVDYDKKLRPFVRVANGCIIEDQHYSIPLRLGLREIGGVVGMGNTLDEAIKNCRENASQVGGCDVKVNDSAMDDAMAIVDEARSYGIELL